jgi:hypothetical protein
MFTIEGLIMPATKLIETYIIFDNLYHHCLASQKHWLLYFKAGKLPTGSN